MIELDDGGRTKRNVFFQGVFASYGLTDSYRCYRTDIYASCEIILPTACFAKLPGEHL